LAEYDSQNGTCRTGQADQRGKTDRQRQKTAGRIQLSNQICKDKNAKTRLPGQDGRERTARAAMTGGKGRMGK
jgi:hypothetical protein